MSITTLRTTSTTNSYTSQALKKDIKMSFLELTYTSNATVGNRQIRAILYNNLGEALWTSRAGAVQAANLIRDYEWMSGVYREAAFIDGSIQIPFPTGIVIQANQYFKVYDSNNIAAGDSMVISMQYSDVSQY